MTQEEKAKRYDEALHKAKNYYSTTDSSSDIKLIGLIFPELKESDDEKIRKEIIDFIYDKTDTYELREKSNSWLAWLEKQGKHANFRNKIQIGDKVTRNEDGVLVNLSQLNRVAKKQTEQKPYGQREECVDCQFNYAGECKGYCAMKRGEQKPTDKVEPKFKVGDIIRHKEQGFTCKIIAVDTEYRLSECCGTHLPIEWQDAYELVEQKNTWTKEDNEMLDSIIEEVRYMGDFPDYPTKEEVELYDECLVKVDWLKSLKERYTWKPSDGQMDALHYVTNFDYGGHKATLVSLYEQLKKLK